MVMRWFSDTLAKRIFVLMWVSLVVSHLVAHQVVVGFVLSPHPTIAKIEDASIPSLPPIPGFDTGEPATTPYQGVAPIDDGEAATRDGSERSRRPPPPPPDERGMGPGGPGGPPGPGEGAVGSPPRDDGQAGVRVGGGPSGHAFTLPAHALAIDFAIRIAVIAAFALFGARWLAVPVRRLVEASEKLTENIAQGGAAPPLDEHQGTVEVRKAASVFNSMARQLSEQFRSRELLAAALSHDLRTPLTRIRVRLEPLQESQMKAKTISDIQEMNVLIDDSMEVFRNASSSEPLRKTDVLGLCQSIVDDAVEQRQTATLFGDTAVTLAKPKALRRVVSNLVNNAIRYGGNAIVSVRNGADEVTIHVEDDGPGIPDSERERVFRPFFRLDPSRSRTTGGSGLGLFIARDLASKQGATLELENRETGGLRATVRLPKAS